jgi:hypothetical protein
MTFYQATTQQVSTSVLNETMVLNYGSGIYYNLDAVGSFVWNLLQSEPISKEYLVDKICTEFDVEPSQCESNLSLLLEELTKEELIAETN